MRALVLPRPGPGAPFELRQLPACALPAGHLWVRVAAAGLNPIDTKLRTRGGPLLPDHGILGCDFAGTVEAVASDVTGFRPGDAVFGLGGGVAGTAGGTLADQLLVDAALAAPKPEALTMREAAAVPLVALTAWLGLNRAGVTTGTRLLVRGGAGGVGHMVVQIGRAFGATVTATARSANSAELVRSLGAQPVAPDGLPARAFDVVFDAAGGDDVDPLFDTLRIGGELILIASPELDSRKAFMAALSVHYVMVVLPLLTGSDREGHGAALREIARLIDKGLVRPIVDQRRFTLATAAEAFALLESGAARIKAVLDIAED